MPAAHLPCSLSCASPEQCLPVSGPWSQEKPHKQSQPSTGAFNPHAPQDHTSSLRRHVKTIPAPPDVEPARHLADPHPSDFGRSPDRRWLSLDCQGKMPPPAARCAGVGEEEDEDGRWRWLLWLLPSAPLPILGIPCLPAVLGEWVGRASVWGGWGGSSASPRFPVEYECCSRGGGSSRYAADGGTALSADGCLGSNRRGAGGRAGG